MSERIFRAVGLGYLMEMPALGTTFEVDRLRRVSGELHGDVTVRSRWPGAKTFDGVMHSSRFNLTAPSTRKTVARILSERAPAQAGEELDWLGFLEEFAQRVLTAERQGAPFEDVGTRPQRIDAGLLLDPLMPAKKATILFGDGGAGKSFLAVAIAVSVATGREIVPGFLPRFRTPVLYLDWETDPDDMDGRVKAVCCGAGVDPVSIRYRICARPLADQVEEVGRAVDQHEIGLVIVDSVGLAAGTSSEGSDAAESALRLFTAIRALGVTTLCIDHVAKAAGAQQGGAGKPYGSTYKVNLARSVWEMRRAKAPGDERTHVALYHRKANTMALHRAIGLVIDFASDNVRFDREEISDDDLTSAMSAPERIAALLAEHPLRVKEIAERAEMTESAVRTYLSRGKGSRFTKLETGDWGLLARPSMASAGGQG